MIFSYISSDMIKKSWSIDKSAIALISSLSITAPVGFDGEFKITALVFLFIFSWTSSAFNLNSFSISQLTPTTFPSANFIHASYERKLGSGKITSSFFSINACAHIYNASLAPAVTIMFSGFVFILLSFLNFWVIASLNSI